MYMYVESAYKHACAYLCVINIPAAKEHKELGILSQSKMEQKIIYQKIAKPLFF